MRAAAWILLFELVVCAPFVWLLGDHGHIPWDDGFILGYAWRVWLGQVPYVDFLYYCPPLTPWMHSLWFAFGDSAYAVARYGYFLQIGLSAAAFAAWGICAGGLPRRPAVFALLAAFTILSLHVFPVMPWYTVDGVMFGAFGAVCLLFSLRGATGPRLHLLRATAVGCAVLAALAKQTFAGMVVLVALLALIDVAIRRRRGECDGYGRAVAALLCGLVPLAATGVVLYIHDALPVFFRAVGSLSSSSALADLGVRSYLKAWPLGLPLAAAGSAASFLSRERPRLRGVALLLLCVPFAGLFATSATGASVISRGFAMFYLAAGVGLAEMALDIRTRAADRWPWSACVLVSLALAWSSALSMGWNTPLLGIAATAPLFARVAARIAPLRCRLDLAIAVAACAAVFVIFFRLQSTVYYRDTPRTSQNMPLQTVYPRFGRLYVSRATYDRYLDLQRLRARLRAQGHTRFLMFGGYPLMSYLENQNPEVGLDWYQPEMVSGQADRVTRDIGLANAVALVVRERTPCREAPHFAMLVGSAPGPLALLAETSFFCAFAVTPSSPAPTAGSRPASDPAEAVARPPATAPAAPPAAP